LRNRQVTLIDSRGYLDKQSIGYLVELIAGFVLATKLPEADVHFLRRFRKIKSYGIKNAGIE